MVNSSYIPNLVSLSHSHGLEEALEAHGCGHGYQGVRGPGDRPGERPKCLLNRPLALPVVAEASSHNLAFAFSCISVSFIIL